MAAADRGRRVLVVSTDPAHSLGDVLRRNLTSRPSNVPVRRGSLRACELDADSALTRWLAARRPALAAIIERGTWLDRADVEAFLNLALPGVDELLGLIEIERLGAAGGYDEVVVDTAPTGHTLRLLDTPSTFTNLARVLDLMQEKHRVLAAALGSGARSDASEALIDEIREDGERLAARLRDPARTRFRWITLPETLSIGESARAISRLRLDGIRVSDIAINRLTPPPPSACALCEGRQRAEADAVRDAASQLDDGRTTLSIVTAKDTPPQGITALRAFARAIMPLERWTAPPRRRVGTRRAHSNPRNALLPALAGGPSTRLLIVGGKGGVGKTTCAAALALAIARADAQRRVLLLSTDPAHSIGDVLDQQVADLERRVRGGPANLRTRELDAEGGWKERGDRYRASVARLMDASDTESHVELTVDRRILDELFALAPPGMDEITGMLTIIDAVLPERGAPRFDLVIVDTAPTGHALRLLAVPGQAKAWVRQFMKVLLQFKGAAGFAELASELLLLSRGLDRLQRLLAAPRSCGFIVVTRPERLPVLETARLVRWLQAHEIARRALIINALTPPGCARCRRAARRERRETAELTGGAARGTVIATTPAVAPPPRGARQIETWAATWRAAP